MIIISPMDIGGNCPVQAEGKIDDKEYYFRSRGSFWSLSIGDDWSKPEYTHSEYYDIFPNAGYMELDIANIFIQREFANYRADMLEINFRVKDSHWINGVYVFMGMKLKPMNTKNKKTVGKFLAYILRHNPESIDIKLDPAGWGEIKYLVHGIRSKGFDIDVNDVLDIVKNDDKQRFSINKSYNEIRACQGHSIPVDLGLEPSYPPTLLYHGTSLHAAKVILDTGLIPMSRQYVHLSVDVETAMEVGKRKSKDVTILEIQARSASYTNAYYISENGVWMTREVQPQYISVKSC